MANTITKQTIQDGDRNLIVNIHITGDNSGDESDTQLIDMSAYNAETSRAGGGRAIASLNLLGVESHLEGFSATLAWDATADVDFLELPNGDANYCFRKHGGIPNNAGAGVTGDIMISTHGLATEYGHLTLHMKKKF